MKAVGFTGTGEGMTYKQMKGVVKALENARLIHGAKEFHHGDCVGSDGQAARFAWVLGYEIHCHPPIKQNKREFEAYHVIYKAKEYLDRDRDIVDAVEFMIGTPRDTEKKLPRSGTWYTLRYARKQVKRALIIMPNGESYEQSTPCEEQGYRRKKTAASDTRS